jgi:hypothetical protein
MDATAQRRTFASHPERSIHKVEENHLAVFACAAAVALQLGDDLGIMVEVDDPAFPS